MLTLLGVKGLKIVQKLIKADKIYKISQANCSLRCLNIKISICRITRASPNVTLQAVGF